MCFTLYAYQCYKQEGQYTGGFSQATVASLELLVKYVKITVIFNSHQNFDRPFEEFTMLTKCININNIIKRNVNNKI